MRSPAAPILSPKPVLRRSITFIALPSASVPTLVPIRIAIIIPVIAPPAINPELKSAPGPISDSSLSSFFLLSTNHLTNPPIKIGEDVDKGR